MRKSLLVVIAALSVASISLPVVAQGSRPIISLKDALIQNKRPTKSGILWDRRDDGTYSNSTGRSGTWEIIHGDILKATGKSGATGCDKFFVMPNGYRDSRPITCPDS